MFIEDEITIIKKYDGCLLGEEAEAILMKFISENEDSSCAYRNTSGDAWLWVFESLDVIKENDGDISYLEENTDLTPAELIKLRKILLEAKKLGIHKISF